MNKIKNYLINFFRGFGFIVLILLIFSVFMGSFILILVFFEHFDLNKITRHLPEMSSVFTLAAFWGGVIFSILSGNE